MLRNTLILITLLIAPGAMASEVFLSQTTISGHADTLNFGQSFTAPVAKSVTGIRLSMLSSMGGSEITVTLHPFDRSPLALDPTVLSTGVLPEASVPTSAAWVKIPMSPAAPLIAGETYAFFVTATDPGGVTGWNNYGVSFNEAYTGGEYFGMLFGEIYLSNIDDLAFEIVGTEIVPEPGTEQLLVLGGAIGLVAVVHARRRSVSRT